MKPLNMNWGWLMQQAKTKGEKGVGILRRYLSRCQEDGVTITAGHLAYVTLLSLVPMVALSLTMLSAFGEMRELVESYVYENFFPAASEAIAKYMNDFVRNASKTTSLGIMALFVVAFMLMSAIDKALNRIWRIKQKRRFIQTFSTYWMILTLGPALVSVSIAATSYLVSLNFVGEVGWLKTQLLKLLPFLMSTLVFAILFLLVPNKVVKLKHGLAGALLTALLFEIAKRSFALYIAKFTSYSAIYGALAAIPIVFVWVYLSWLIVLLGAVLTATLGEYGSDYEEVEEQ